MRKSDWLLYSDFCNKIEGKSLLLDSHDHNSSITMTKKVFDSLSTDQKRLLVLEFDQLIDFNDLEVTKGQKQLLKHLEVLNRKALEERRNRSAIEMKFHMTPEFSRDKYQKNLLDLHKQTLEILDVTDEHRCQLMHEQLLKMDETYKRAFESRNKKDDGNFFLTHI